MFNKALKTQQRNMFVVKKAPDGKFECTHITSEKLTTEIRT